MYFITITILIIFSSYWAFVNIYIFSCVYIIIIIFQISTIK